MRRAALALLPLTVVLGLFIVVLNARPTPSWRTEIPKEPFRADRCTWYCHNHGCRHRASLPGWLSADSGAFGVTMRGLYALGRVLPGGYRSANLAVFCVGWPALTYGLWIVALRQHRRLQRERRRS